VELQKCVEFPLIAVEIEEWRGFTETRKFRANSVERKS
jgi:hypothetical protein